MNIMSIVSSSFIGAEKKTLPFWGHFFSLRSGFILLLKMYSRKANNLHLSIILDKYNRLFCASHYSTFQIACIAVLDVFLSLHRMSFDLTC